MLSAARAFLHAQDDLRLVEAAPWLLALAVPLFFPGECAFGTQVLVMMLFALSLDLILGYAGIVTLGHAAFFGGKFNRQNLHTQFRGRFRPPS